MKVTVEPVPYALTVLHGLKYPSKGVCGILLGTKHGDHVKVSGAVPLSHETTPLAPVLEVGLSLIHARFPNIVGVYFSNQHYQDTHLPSYATKLAERVSSVCGVAALLVQVVNWQLSPDCPTNCLSAHAKDGETWKEYKLDPSSEALSTLSAAIQKKMHRDVMDVDNHLDKPESDFFNTSLGGELANMVH